MRAKAKVPVGGATHARTIAAFKKETLALLKARGVSSKEALRRVKAHAADVKRAWRTNRPPCAATDQIMAEEKMGMHGKRGGKRDPRRKAVRIPRAKRAAVSRRVRQLVAEGYSPGYAARRAYHPHARHVKRDPSKITVSQRRALHPQQFALPEREALPLSKSAKVLYQHRQVANAATRLAQMHKRGTVTEHEYQEARRRIEAAEHALGMGAYRKRRRARRDLGSLALGVALGTAGGGFVGYKVGEQVGYDRGVHDEVEEEYKRYKARGRRDASPRGAFYARIAERENGDAVFDVYDAHHKEVGGGRAPSVHEARARVLGKYPGARIETCAMRCEVSRDPTRARSRRRGMKRQRDPAKDWWVLKRDGQFVMEGTSFDIAKYIHRHHSYSVSHALKYEGYSMHAKTRRDPSSFSETMYEANEFARFQKELKQVEKAPLAARKEGAKEFAKAMAQDPETVGERVGWLLAGHYGYGAHVQARKAVQGRGNAPAYLTQVVGSIEWNSPFNMTRAAWSKLTSTQKSRLAHFVEEAITSHLRDLREE